MKNYDINDIAKALRRNTQRSVPTVVRIQDDAPRPREWTTVNEPRGAVTRPSDERISSFDIRPDRVELVDFENGFGPQTRYGIREGSAFRKVYLNDATGELHVDLDLIF